MKNTLSTLLRGLNTMASSQGGGRANSLMTLIYHRVLAKPDPMRPGEVDARLFEWQMDILAKHYNVLPFEKAVEMQQAGILPARAVAITFDDGYADNHSVALDILLNRGLTATFFVATAFLDGGTMWNDQVIEAIRDARSTTVDLSDIGLGRHSVATAHERSAVAAALLLQIKHKPQTERTALAQSVMELLKHKPSERLMMTPEEVRALHLAGMQIGAHTRTHPILATLERAQAEQEIAGSKRDLESLLQSEVSAFAYPNGRRDDDYIDRDVELVRASGYRCAVTTHWGAATRQSDRFQLPRFTPWDQTEQRFLLRMALSYRKTRS